ncbi:FecCD family ABC transporter permease [Paracoccus ravus]|uniref:FecCD family ABC transporter permease n=1 Tax=Paracoccus ravus TaxID=2447760 RepID=UPI00106E6617|nr:iron chelate uptake ABC transporter family permease subunit [Paracoccus ravus]
MISPTIRHLAAGRSIRRRQRQVILALLAGVICLAFALSLMLGKSFVPSGAVLGVLRGENVPGMSFIVGQLRLPRALLAMLAGLCFGMGGAAFQILLRNPLASPDIIGINMGTSAAAVFAIVVPGLEGAMVSVCAVAAGMAIAMAIYALSFRQGVTGSRLSLIGIGVSAMLQSVIAWILSRAPAWDLQEAMRWLTGSVNGAGIDQIWPLLAALALFGTVLLAQARNLETLRMGDDLAVALGIRSNRTRFMVFGGAVGLMAIATSMTGPIAAVAFLSGSIAARITGNNGSLLLPAGLIGAGLVLVGDYAGQNLMPGRYPVGVETGALGAPYLIYLILRVNRGGDSL